MCIHMHIRIHVNKCASICTCMHACLRTCLHTYMFGHIHMYTHSCIHAHICTRVYIHNIYICVYVYICMCVSMCVYIYTYMNICVCIYAVHAHTYIRTYIHIRFHIHIYMRLCLWGGEAPIGTKKFSALRTPERGPSLEQTTDGWSVDARIASVDTGASERLNPKPTSDSYTLRMISAACFAESPERFVRDEHGWTSEAPSFVLFGSLFLCDCRTGKFWKWNHAASAFIQPPRVWVRLRWILVTVNPFSPRQGTIPRRCACHRLYCYAHRSRRRRVVWW